MKKMTSKQALKQLKENVYELDDWQYYRLNIIEKDLEILEILKNKNVDVDVIKNIMKDNRKFECYPYENLTQEEFNKIKDWLEND